VVREKEDVVASRAEHSECDRHDHGYGIPPGARPKCDVKVNNSSPPTPKNEPRNRIDIESNFSFESEPKVFGFSLSVSYQEEYFASGFASV
jgi:hypothetical protein